MKKYCKMMNIPSLKIKMNINPNFETLEEYIKNINEKLPEY